MNKFEELQALVQVAESASISQAAQRLNIAKSAVSRRISELEHRLGIQLFYRTTRHISLTDSGSTFYHSAVRILTDLNEAELAVSQQHGAIAGRLKIAAPLSFGLLHLGPAINDFLEIHPQVQFELDFNDRQVDIMQEGFDLAIRIANLPDSSYIARRIAPIHQVVCASSHYLAKSGMPELPADLQHHRCLVYTNSVNPMVWRYHDTEGRQYSVKVNAILKANNGDFLRDTAINGQGIVCLPTFIVNDAIEQNELQPLLTSFRWPGSDAFALYPPTQHVSTRVRVFIEFLVNRFKEKPYWDSCLDRKRVS